MKVVPVCVGATVFQAGLITKPRWTSVSRILHAQTGASANKTNAGNRRRTSSSAAWSTNGRPGVTCGTLRPPVRCPWPDDCICCSQRQSPIVSPYGKLACIPMHIRKRNAIPSRLPAEKIFRDVQMQCLFFPASYSVDRIERRNIRGKYCFQILPPPVSGTTPPVPACSPSATARTPPGCPVHAVCGSVMRIPPHSRSPRTSPGPPSRSVQTATPARD